MTFEIKACQAGVEYEITKEEAEKINQGERFEYNPGHNNFATSFRGALDKKLYGIGSAPYLVSRIPQRPISLTEDQISGKDYFYDLRQKVIAYPGDVQLYPQANVEGVLEFGHVAFTNSNKDKVMYSTNRTGRVFKSSKFENKFKSL